MRLRVSIKDKHSNDKMSNGYRGADHIRNPKTTEYRGCLVSLWAGLSNLLCVAPEFGKKVDDIQYR